MDDGFKSTTIDGIVQEKDLERVATGAHVAEAEEELDAVNTAASEHLPFSKARCVALVATIAAAPFLNVGESRPSKRSNVNAISDNGCSSNSDHPSDHRGGSQYTDEPTTMDCFCVQPHVRLFPG